MKSENIRNKDRIQWNNVRFVPVLHGRLEFAQEVRRQFEEFDPRHVAVEYPHTLRRRVLQGIKRLPLLSVVHYEESDGTMVYLLLEATDGQVEALRLASERGIPAHFIDRDTEAYPLDTSPMPDSYSLTRIGHFEFCRAFLKVHPNPFSQHEDILREKTMSYNLQQLNKTGERVLFVGGLAHLPGILKMIEEPQTRVIGRTVRKGVHLAHLHEESSREITTEMPYLAAQYENRRGLGKAGNLDRCEVIQELVREAGEEYWKNSREELTSNQIRILNKFGRNYALLSGRLVPNFYQLIVASRGAVDDDFAYEIWKKGSMYPWQTEEPELPVLRLQGEDLFLDRRRIRFHRRLKVTRRRLVPMPLKKKASKEQANEWKRQFQGLAICSYPPEDVVIEGYGRYLKKKAMQIKSEDNTRIQPFSSSMLDGLDVRETLRNWLTDKKIYVREEMPISGKVGSVVVIFDPDLPDDEGNETFPWCVTWLGEHDQESDMAFYSTPAGEVLEGPGISRCQYGGFMLTYPPKRVYDVWRDPFFKPARNKPELLLMAALDYSLEKHVVYVASSPPSGRCQSMASKLGKKIVYLPIGTFSPVTLKKIRNFHVLDGYHVRRYARHYI